MPQAQLLNFNLKILIVNSANQQRNLLIHRILLQGHINSWPQLYVNTECQECLFLDKESFNHHNDNSLIGILLITVTSAEECAIELCIFALASGTWLFATALDKLSHFLDCLTFCHPQRLPFHSGIIDLNPSKVYWRGKVLPWEQTFAPCSTLIDCSPCVEKERITCWWNCLNVVCVTLKVELHSSFIDGRES